MAPTEFNFTPRSGLQLKAVRYAAASPKALFVFNHGYGEHAGRYTKVFTDLAHAGVEVAAFDMRTFGTSQLDNAQRGIIDKFSDVVDDLEDFVQEASAAAPGGLPVFVGGSSLGGLIAGWVALRLQPSLAGLLLFSPGLGVEWTPLLRVQAAFGSLLAALVPRARIVPAVRVEDLSEDEAVREAYLNDPLTFVGNVRARTANEILAGMRGLEARHGELRLPVYGQHGATDRCTSLDAHRRFMAGISSEDKTLNVVEGGYHELLHGPQRVECTRVVTDWILQRAAARPAQTAAKI